VITKEGETSLVILFEAEHDNGF